MTTTVDIQDRISKCQKILETDPNSQIFAALAEAYRRNGDLDKAFRICQNGLKIHPSYGSAHVVMAKINLDRRLYDWAEIEAKKAAELDGRTRATELLLAEIHIYKGEFNPAIKLLKKLHETDGDNGQIKRLLEIARQLPEQQAEITEPRVVNEPLPENRVEEIPAEPDRPAETRNLEELSISEVLKASIGYRGVDGALFVNYEGLVIEKEWTMSMDPAACGAVLAQIGNEVNQELVQGYFGGARAVLVETSELTFYLMRMAKGVFLFVANAESNLGSLRMKLEGLLDRQSLK